jgi:hypothetical protein
MIWRPWQLTRAPREARRLEAGRLWPAGPLSHAAMARQMGVRRTAVSRWAQPLRQRQGDLSRVNKRRVPGRPPRLTPEPWPLLRQGLGRGARQAGCDTACGTLGRIRAVMLVACGVASPAPSLSHRLHPLGGRPPHPAVSARAREDALVQAWLTPEWARMHNRLVAEAR